MSVISGTIGAVLGKKGADAQVDASRDAARVAREIFDIQRQDAQPWQRAGTNALAALNFEMGLGERPTIGGAFAPGSGDERPTIDTIRGMEGVRYNTEWDASQGRYVQTPVLTGPPSQTMSYRVGDESFDTMQAAQDRVNALVSEAQAANPGTPYQGFQATPGYQFRVDQGQQAIERSAAARGGLNSGATMKALQRFGQNIAADEYGTYLNRLGALSGVGQVANNQVASAAQNYGAQAGNALMAAGNARASGYNAIGQGVGNVFQGIGQAAGLAYGMGAFGGGGTQFQQMWRP